MTVSVGAKAARDFEGCDCLLVRGNASSAAQKPAIASIEGVDKKSLSCFPDIEKVTTPSSMVPKAGVAIEKRLSKLEAGKDDLEKECEQTAQVTKRLNLTQGN